MSRVNTSNAHVHVATGGSGVPNLVVGPGDSFPDDVEDLDPALYADQDEDDDDAGVPGPGQTSADLVRQEAPVNAEWKGVTVPKLQEALAAQDPPVEFTGDDRKDALVEKAVAAGLSPDDFKDE